jgi:hypothetical protein
MDAENTRRRVNRRAGPVYRQAFWRAIAVDFRKRATMKECFFALRFAVVLVLLIMKASLQAGSRSSDLFNVSMQNVNSLQGILRFGTENHIPVGIILDSQVSLCNSPRNVSLKSASIGSVMDTLLVASEYVWSMDEGILVVRPRNLPESSSYVLNLKFERFTGMKSTIQGLGIILNGYIHGKLRPTEGYAGDILQSPDSEQVGPLDLSNATVTQIANNIVSLDGKGTWVLYPVPENTSQIAAVRRLYVYGYSDDSGTIAGLSCDNPNGP